MAKRAGGSRASRAKEDRAAHPVGATDREHVLAAEAADKIAAYALPGDAGAFAGVIEEHIEAPDREPGKAEQDQHPKDAAANASVALGGLRQLIVRHADFKQPPYMRVVGRVVYVLTVSRGWPACTGPEVFRVFLQEIPSHLSAGLRQTPRFDEEVDATKDTGLRTIYKRLWRLVDERYAQTTAVTQDDKAGQYVMTEIGRMIFCDWPSHVLLGEAPTTRERPRRPARHREGSRPIPGK